MTIKLVRDFKDKQELFDYVATELFKQGGPSIHSSGAACLYRGENGRKCAAGLVMDDDTATAYEGYATTRIIGLPFADTLYILQYAHDNAALAPQGPSKHYAAVTDAAFMDRLIPELYKAAKKIGVKPDILTELATKR